MGTMVTNLLAGGIQGLAETAKGIIEEFHMSPEQKAEQLAKIAAAQQAAQQAANDYDTKMNEIAGQNIRADDATADKYTQRARPSFMYIVEVILGFNYIAIPATQIFMGKALAPVVLPADLLTLFGVCVTGYVCSRTAEKISALSGDSQIKLPFGLGGISNKS